MAVIGLGLGHKVKWLPKLEIETNNILIQYGKELNAKIPGEQNVNVLITELDEMNFKIISNSHTREIVKHSNSLKWK